MFHGLRERKHVHYFRTLSGVVGMLRNPEGTDSVFDIEDGLRDIEASRLAVEHALSFPSVRAMAEERYLRPVPDIEQLAAMPEGTLGYHYAHHLKTHGFDPDYYRKIGVETDAEYLALRMRQTHDIWHVVTGLSADRTGELAVKACELAQTRRPMAAVITAGGMIRYLLKDPDQLPDVMEALYKGYTIGSRAKPLLAEKWEEQWGQRLDSIRVRLDIEPGDYLPTASDSGDAEREHAAE